MTHTKKDCLERPRKVGARYSGRDIAQDEVVHDDSKHLNGLQGQGDYDAKRDRWDGYDPAQHRHVVDEYEALEQARRKLREDEIDKGTANAQSNAVAKLAGKGKVKGKKGKKNAAAADDDSDEFGSSDESDGGGSGAEADEDKYAEGADVAGQKLDTKTRVTVRNLRIREDTAKYLLNLDTESAYYDPKTRSMREAPNPDVALEDVRPAFALPPRDLLVRPQLTPLPPLLLRSLSSLDLSPSSPCRPLLHPAWPPHRLIPSPTLPRHLSLAPPSRSPSSSSSRRPSSPARTLRVTAAARRTSTSCSSSRGSPSRAGTTCTSSRTRRRPRSRTRSSSRRRTCSRRRARRASSTGTAASSTSRRRRGSCAPGRTRATSSTTAGARSSKAWSAQRPRASTTRTVRL